MGFWKGFVCAARGVRQALAQERNLRFHACAAVYVCLFSRFYPFAAAQKAVLAMAVGGVLSLELLNTALERLVDAFTGQRSRSARFIKDAAAGAVLVFCLGAAACGFFLFWDTAVFARILRWFAVRPAMLALLAASLAGSGWFIFLFGRKPKEKAPPAPARPEK